MKRFIVLATTVIVFWEAANLLLTTQATKKETALTDLVVTESRIRDYVLVHHALPRALSDLPTLTDGRVSSLVDPWGREFTYSRGADNQITLGTKGPDGVHGFAVRFNPYDADFPMPATVPIDLK